MKKVLIILLSLILCITCIPAYAFAGSDFSVQIVDKAGTYDADEVIAVNINASAGDGVSRSATCSWSGVSNLSAGEDSVDSEYYESESLPLDSFNNSNIYDYNEYNGLWIEDATGLLDSPEESEIDNSDLYLDENLGRASYSVGSTCTIKDGVSYKSVKLVCLYIGEHCTVWGSTSQKAKIRITTAIAEEIADTFDSVYQLVNDSIGTALDPDGDGKLAIHCFDIGDDYTTYGDVYGKSSYTAGYFWANELNGYSSSAQDIINIDTYPAMTALDISYYSSDEGAALKNISSIYGTLVHEYQHLINYSYSKTASLGEMETFLDEGFAMGTEHLVFGPDKTYKRINTFNTSTTNYYAGSPLCSWESNNVVLANYSNSYMFVQYLRTQYAQLIGSDTGNTFYKSVQQERVSRKKYSAWDVISSNILNTAKEDLIVNFWTAVYLKDDSGAYSFNGEAWARNIKPRDSFVATSGSSGTITTYNGGAVFGSVPTGKIKISSLSSSMKIVLITYTASYIDESSDCIITYDSRFDSYGSVDFMSEKTVTIERSSGESYTVYAAVYDANGKLVAIAPKTSSGEAVNLTLPKITSNAKSLSFFIVDSDSLPVMNVLSFGE